MPTYECYLNGKTYYFRKNYTTDHKKCSRNRVHFDHNCWKEEHIIGIVKIPVKK